MKITQSDGATGKVIGYIPINSKIEFFGDVEITLELKDGTELVESVPIESLAMTSWLSNYLISKSEVPSGIVMEAAKKIASQIAEFYKIFGIEVEHTRISFRV